jgi:hypothetical protein
MRVMWWGSAKDVILKGIVASDEWRVALEASVIGEKDESEDPSIRRQDKYRGLKPSA